MLYKEIEPIIKEALPPSLRNEEIKNICDTTQGAVPDCLLVLQSSVSGKYIINDNDINNISPRLIICDESIDIKTNIITIKVKSARECLSYIYSLYYRIDYSKTDFIAITGTNGKTTTATMIYEILLYAGYKVGFIGTGKIEYMKKRENAPFYSMTTPDAKILYSSIAQMQEAGAEVIVMEVSSHAIALKKITPIPFKYGLFLNLSSEHMDFHKSIEEYYNTKKSLFSQVENGIFNTDDKYSERAMRECFDICNTTSVGIVYEAEARAQNISLFGFSGASYFYKDEKRIFKQELSLPGYHNIYNSLFALKCTIDYGVKPYIAKEALNHIRVIDGRFETINDDITVIIDYAHTPAAFESILLFVNSNKNIKQKVVTVFGCGGERDKEKRPVMAKIATKYSDLSIITEDNSRGEPLELIINDITSQIQNSRKVRIIKSRKDAIEYAILSSADNDIILILGKGHEKYNIGANGYTVFDEKKIIIDALNKRKEKKIDEN